MVVSFDRVYEAIIGTLCLDDCHIEQDTPLRSLDQTVGFNDVLSIFHMLNMSSVRIGGYFQRGKITDLGKAALRNHLQLPAQEHADYLKSFGADDQSYVGNLTPAIIGYFCEIGEQ